MGLDTMPNGLRSASEPNDSIDFLGEKWLVQKFGGTSVGKFPLNIVGNVVRRVFHFSVLLKFCTDILQTESVTWQSCSCLLGTE